MPKITKSKTMLFSNKLRTYDFEHLDVVHGDTFWPHDILDADLWKNTTLGVIDGKGLWSPRDIDSNVTSHFCNITECYQTETNSDLNTMEDKHSSTVTYVALKYIPGIKNVEHYDVLSSDSSVLSLRLALLEIEKHLKILATTNKNYIYILNISLRIDTRIHKLVKNDVEFETSSMDLIHPLLSRLYKEYPRFQIFVSAGNNAKDASMHRLFIQLPEVISVAAHDLFFQQAKFSNFGPHITTSTLGTTIVTVDGVGDGTSLSTPKIAAIGAIIMSMIPDLKNYELKKIIQQLSVPDHEFFESHNKDAGLRLKTPVFIFDLVRFNEILNSEYSSRVDEKLLALVNAKAKTYFLDNFVFVFQDNCVRFVMPNYGAKIRFNVLDSVIFSMNVSNSWRIERGVSFILSSGRLPPFQLTKSCYPNIDFDKKYNIENLLLFQPEQILLPPNFNGKVTVVLKRTPEKIMLKYKIADNAPMYKEISYNGIGEVKDVMLGLSAASAIKVSYFQPLQRYIKDFEASDYSFASLEPNLALQSKNSLAFTGSMLAAAGLLFVFAARYFQKKASITANATTARPRLNF